MDITKSKVQNFSRYFLRACYSIAPNGPVHEFKKKQKMKNKMKKERKRKAKRRKKRAS